MRNLNSVEMDAVSGGGVIINGMDISQLINDNRLRISGTISIGSNGEINIHGAHGGGGQGVAEQKRPG